MDMDHTKEDYTMEAFLIGTGRDTDDTTATALIEDKCMEMDMHTIDMGDPCTMEGMATAIMAIRCKVEDMDLTET